MAYQFILAEKTDVPAVFEIISKRVHWMNEKGIKQWNTTDYLNVYPLSYYEEHQHFGRLYKIINGSNPKILGVMVLLDKDPRWPGYEKMDSYFVHNFATDPAVNGIGSLMLEAAERLSIHKGKTYLRLDCPKENEYLNNFYQTRGYEICGSCVDGAYSGILREKKL